MALQENYQNILKVALLQTALVWEDAEANRNAINEELNEISDPVDLIVLPEMVTTGFSMKPRGLAEKMTGPTVNWLQSISREKDLAICGSVIIEEEEKYFNRFLWVEKGEVLHVYDKRHLFTMAGEHHEYSSGTQSQDFQFRGWRLLPRICYDLRFPVWNRSTEVDLQIYVANWPSPRVEAWYTLLQARAIENQCYVIGVNRIGRDGNNIEYPGYSVVFDAKGRALTPERNRDAGWIMASLDRDTLRAFRSKFPIQNDADPFQFLS